VTRYGTIPVEQRAAFASFVDRMLPRRDDSAREAIQAAADGLGDFDGPSSEDDLLTGRRPYDAEVDA
jgi:hypothetical protein